MVLSEATRILSCIGEVGDNMAGLCMGTMIAGFVGTIVCLRAGGSGAGEFCFPIDK